MFDRKVWRDQWKAENPDKVKAQIERDNAAKRERRKIETPEEREVRLAKQRARHKAWRDANKEKLKDWVKRDRAQNMDRIRRTTRAYSITRQYGISLEDYEAMLTSQGKRCAICGTDKACGRHTDHSWRVDHCHTTGKVRALLCHNCNISLGLLKENTSTMKAMIDYLNHHTITHGGNDNDQPD